MKTFLEDVKGQTYTDDSQLKSLFPRTSPQATEKLIKEGLLIPVTLLSEDGELGFLESWTQRGHVKKIPEEVYEEIEDQLQVEAHNISSRFAYEIIRGNNV